MSSTANYRVTCVLAGAEVMVVTCTLHEALSQPFFIELEVYEHRLAMQKITHQEMLQGTAQITLWQGKKPMRHLQGMIYRLEAGKVERYHNHYQVGVTAALYQTHLTSDCRIFQQKTVDEILRSVLQANGIVHHQLRLQKPRERREYCVQYNETDYDFIHRLVAEEGLIYWFEHHKTHHVLCVGEALTQLPKADTPLEYHEPSAQATEPRVWAFRYQEQLVTARHRQRDYTFKNPRYSLEHNHPGLHLTHQPTRYERFSYNGRYKRDEQGRPFTQYRQEAAQNAQRIALLSGDTLGLCTGQQFTLAQHPTAAQNQAWYSIRSSLHFTQPQALGGELPPPISTIALQNGPAAGTLRIENEAIPFTQAWRTPPRPKPVIDGPQMAHVVGPPGEEIFCDEWGRVKVQFPWDRYGKNDALSSCWIRVAQNWGGAGWGHMAIPRIGHEVIVDFLEGDPDQPIITGRTYHTVNVPPYKLPANKTRMTIKSRTHKGAGFNELRFEDEKDREQIYLHGQKDQDIIIENDRMEWIRRDRHLRVDNDKYEQVGQDSHQTIGQDKQDRIERHRHLYAGGNFIWRIIGQVHRWIGGGLQLFVGASRSTEIGANDDLVIGADQRTAVGNQSYTRARNIVLEANQALTIKAPGGFIKIDAGGIAIKGNIVKLNSGGSPDAGTAPKPPQPDTPQTPSQPKDADARNEH